MSDLLKFEIADGVGTITLNRPEKMNAFTAEMMEAWIAALEGCRTNPEVRAIVMTGTGRAFTTGGDVESFSGSARQTPQGIRNHLVNGSQRLIRKIAEIDKPVIAALNGFATGGGLDIALACDIRFAAEGARFAETYAKMGLIPGMGGAYLLPRIVGVAKALELFWSTDWVDAREAERIGLVNKVFPDAELMDAALAFARKIADGAPLSVQAIKRLVHTGLGQDLGTALDMVASEMTVIRTSEDHKEALAAFKEKRKPRFTGQ